MKIKNCPFCFNESLLQDDPCYKVYCDYCDAYGPPADTALEAIEAWNKRPFETHLVSILKEIK